MPTKPLPARPSLEHLKHQAKDLLRDHRGGHLDACQRLREFHPRFDGASDATIAAATMTLADAHLAIAREYGFASWARLRAHIESGHADALNRPHHERIVDPVFRRAVDLIDDGDPDGLRAHLRQHPAVVRQRVRFEGGNYFTNPTLLEFIAENPIRHDSLPPNIVAVAKTILDADEARDRTSLDTTLGLVCSGRVTRECGVQVPLIDVLCDYGADPNGAMRPALVHGEFDAAQALIERGARVDLPVAAALGRLDTARRELPAADGLSRHLALALAAQHGHAGIVQLLLEAGEDPDRYNPMGSHSHSTPLHQAALAGHADVVRVLVEHGARLDIPDVHHRGTPLGWAEYAGHTDIAHYLRARSHGR